MTLHKPYVPGDDFVPWQSLGGSTRTTHAVSKATHCKKPFRRGDLFAVIYTDDVSDIVPNILWLGIAIHPKKVVQCILQGYGDFNWLSAYQSYEAAGILMLSHRSLTRYSMIKVLFECLKEMIPLADDDRILLYALTQMQRWLDGPEVFLNEEFQTIVTFLAATEYDASTYHRYYFSSALRKAFQSIEYPNDSDRNISGSFSSLQAGFLEKYPLGGGHLELFRQIVIRMIPVQTAILANIEKGWIEPVTPNLVMP